MAVSRKNLTSAGHDSGAERTPSLRPLDILKVQRTCVHDGPGIRTTIFFQGCNLSCAWCQNPESRPPSPPKESSAASNQMVIDEILKAVALDSDYYKSTGGGVTLSGGEPLLQPAGALVDLLTRLKSAGLHVALETSLHAPRTTLLKVAPLVDLFIVDLKHAGTDADHIRCTQRDSTLIRRNLEQIWASNLPRRFRMVVVPGFNDDENNLSAVANLLKSHGDSEIELLKFHSMYESKAAQLGLNVPSLGIGDKAAGEALEKAGATLTAQGMTVQCQNLAPTTARQTPFPQRVHDIQKAIRTSDHALSFEVSKLKTRFYKSNGFKDPAPIHRAKRLAYVLEHKQIIVWPKELIVGNFTEKRRAGQVWEEHSGALLASILHQIHRQKPVSFQCSWNDRIDFYLRTFPFWAKHGLAFKAYRRKKNFILNLARCSDSSTGFNNNLASIAHFIVNYQRILSKGTTGLLQEVEQASRTNPGHEAFYQGVAISLRALETFADRHAQELYRLASTEPVASRKAELEEMAAVCTRVPKNPAGTFHEALQSMMFLHVALCIESFENAVSPGRIDQILFPYYAADLAAKRITYQRARELLALFVLKLDEAILVNDGNSYLSISRLFETMSTDQTITLGGTTPDGHDATNDLTYALLDVCELQPYAANMTARIHPGSPPEYLERIAEVYLSGAPMPALYNDDVYVKSLTAHYEVSTEQARNYAIVGCVEPNASDDHYGNTDCANMNVVLPFLQALTGDTSDLWNLDPWSQIEKLAGRFVEYHFPPQRRGASTAQALHQLLKRIRPSALNGPTDLPATMEQLLNRFQDRLNALAAAVLDDHQSIEEVIAEEFPTPLASALFPGAIAKGLDVNQGGASLNSSGIQAVGVTDVADSLHAIDQLVFKEGRFSLAQIVEAMSHNFQSDEYQEIHRALKAVPKFGDDASAEAAHWVNRTLEIFVKALANVPNPPRGGIYAAGYYALNVNDMYGKKTPALPSGRLAGTPLANSVTPHYGMASGDLLSALNSVASVDFATYAPNGTTVTFTIDSALFPGSEGRKNLAALFKTFFQKGGMQFQPNVLNRQILLDAYQNPEKYPHLLVRVAGYCAYFNHLSDDLKKIIINRTCYGPNAQP